MTTTEPDGPLKGLKVLELGQRIAGPFAESMGGMRDVTGFPDRSPVRGPALDEYNGQILKGLPAQDPLQMRFLKDIPSNNGSGGEC